MTDPKFYFGTSCSDSRVAAVTLLHGIKMNDDPEERIKMIQLRMRAVASRNMRAGLAIGSGATMMIFIILALIIQWAAQ